MNQDMGQQEALTIQRWVSAARYSGQQSMGMMQQGKPRYKWDVAVRLEATGGRMSRAIQGVICNISASGVCVATRERLEEGCEVLVTVPSFGGLVRSVVRSRKGMLGAYELGLEFILSADQEQRMLMSA